MTYRLNRNAVTSPPPRPATQILRGDFIYLLLLDSPKEQAAIQTTGGANAG